MGALVEMGGETAAHVRAIDAIDRPSSESVHIRMSAENFSSAGRLILPEFRHLWVAYWSGLKSFRNPGTGTANVGPILR